VDDLRVSMRICAGFRRTLVRLKPTWREPPIGDFDVFQTNSREVEAVGTSRWLVGTSGFRRTLVRLKLHI